KQKLKTGEKLLFIVAGAFVLLATIAFGIMQYMMATNDKPIFEQHTHFDLSEVGQRGSQIYRHNACSECHRAMSEGTNMGNSLDGIGTRHDVVWIEQFLSHPEETYDHRTMDHGLKPKQAYYVAELPKEDIHALAVFLSELKSEQGSSSSPVPPKGESPFIDQMVKTWAPDEWKHKYQDIRDKETQTTGEAE
ncbi:MAG: c-type cytochrome, partial [Mariprofundaceae bacterium]|nr:c-type cytochrome [Mariprofundaceae bacterium]